VVGVRGSSVGKTTNLQNRVCPRIRKRESKEELSYRLVDLHRGWGHRRYRIVVGIRQKDVVGFEVAMNDASLCAALSPRAAGWRISATSRAQLTEEPEMARKTRSELGINLSHSGKSSARRL